MNSIPDGKEIPTQVQKRTEHATFLILPRGPIAISANKQEKKDDLRSNSQMK